jgi:hypothetical protein
VLATARERLTAHNESPACAGCHRLTDPMGLTLENFDGIGSFRTQENGKSIDVSGSLDGTNFSGAAALGQARGNNPQTSQCLVQKVFHSGVGQATQGQEPYLEYLADRFRQGGYRIADLMRTIATSRGFYSVSPPKPIPTASRPQQGGPA